jgi:hypothetical protein
VLVLYDFSSKPFDKEDLARYHTWKSLGQGNHRTSAFNVAYFYREAGRPAATKLIRLNIQRRRR